MADTLTTNLLLTNQTEGGNNNSWGTIADANFEEIDDKFGDTTDISTTGGNTALTSAQEIVAAIQVAGTLVSNATITFSGRGGFWIIDNNTTGSFTVTCLVSGQTGVAVAQGGSALVFCDGTDILSGVAEAAATAEVTVASATTTDIAGAASEFVAVSGTATITSFGTGANRKRFARATGAFTITHNASSLICPGGQNILAASGDTFVVVFDSSSNARIYSYQRAAAAPQAVPIGFVGDYAGSTAPSFWLLCYGQAISRTTYATLFAAISTNFGVGDGSTTFNLPDCRGRATSGKDDMGGTSANRLTNQSGGLDGDTLGATGGAETHTLTTAEMPAHTHTDTKKMQNNAAGSDNGIFNKLLVDDTSTSSGGITNQTTPTTSSSTGGGGAHNNVQPTIILNKIIFAGV